jgi:hypothetical protein
MIDEYVAAQAVAEGALIVVGCFVMYFILI